MDECCICLEKTDEIGHYDCGHVFHKECLEKLRKYNFDRCPMCKSLCTKNFKPPNNYTKNIIFNNMTNLEFDVNVYLQKWEKTDCFAKNHEFLIETLGDWHIDNNSNEVVSFSYKIMYVQCKECGMEQLIK